MSQKRPNLACYDIDMCERILVFFGSHVNHKVSNQKTLYYATSKLVHLHCLAKRATRKLNFSLKCCISALPKFNQLLDFFNIFDSRLILTLLYNSLNLVINAFSSGLFGALFTRNEVERAAEVGLLCCMHKHNAPVRRLLGFLFRKVMRKH